MIWLLLAKTTLRLHFGISRWAISRWVKTLPEGQQFLAELYIAFNRESPWCTLPSREQKLDEAYASLGLKRP